MNRHYMAICLSAAMVLAPGMLRGEGDWEITPRSERAVESGLKWLAGNQGHGGHWDCNDMGLVSMGALAFMSAGHMPDHGKYAANVRRALNFVVANAKPSGLLNISGGGRDMYNHGLSVFVLSQAYGMTSDRRVGEALDKGIQLILDMQCEDGGWAYEAIRKSHGHDLSLAVMQAKAMRAAMDMGLEIPPDHVRLALGYIRSLYKYYGVPDGLRYNNDSLSDRPGAFTYSGGDSSTAMAAAGAVCLQEFAQYDDFRIQRSMDRVVYDINQRMQGTLKEGAIPFDAYAMCYVAQALYQVGGRRWREEYPKIRDAIVRTQSTTPGRATYGSWGANGHVAGVEGQLYGTAVAVFALSIPNRYLPILQRGESGTAGLARRVGKE